MGTRNPGVKALGNAAKHPFAIYVVVEKLCFGQSRLKGTDSSMP
jgi:hypothetical protein